MRVLAPLALVLAVAVPADAATPATQLRITLWPRGQSDADRHFWTLSCAPVRGSLPNRASACVRLARLEAPFAPILADSACTEQYGGAAEARVTGVFRGRRVWARFDRRNGCGIGRWQKHAFLFGGVPLPVE